MKLEQNEKAMIFDTLQIPNIFFAEHLSDMPGDYLKIYLYLVFLSKYNGEIGINDLSKKLALPINIINEGMKYLEKEELILRKQQGFEIVDNSNIFAGPQIDINYDHLTEPGKFLVDEPSYKEAGGTANGYNNFNSGLGFLLTYDSRDVPANAYRGMYLDFRGMMYAKFIGSDQTFYRLEIDYRQYKSLGKRRVLAWTAQTKNVFGDVPLTQYALTGTPFDLRGYYMGQYRDKSSHVVMAEYRQMLNTDRSTWVKRMLNHIGFVAWTGCGFMGPTPGKIEGVLPNYGVGLRIEVQPRMNVRLDLGKNTVNNQMLFYFNMTEAF